MGFKSVDIVPISSTGPTTNIPARKDLSTKAFSVLRANTSSTLKCVLPADSSIVGVKMFGGIASDAGTTATVTIVASNNSGAISTGTAVDVKGAGATTAFVQMSGLPNLEPLPLNGDITITATYAETGGASTVGGPWVFLVEYVR